MKKFGEHNLIFQITIKRMMVIFFAGGQGFEPRCLPSKGSVLPLDDPPKKMIFIFYHYFFTFSISAISKGICGNGE